MESNFPAGDADGLESAPAPDAAAVLQELREELAAAGAESRRTARRQMDVLREFGTALEALGNMMRDLHAAAREPVANAAAAAPAGDAEALLLPLIEMADRIARAAGAFQEPPVPASASWWPGHRAALAAWRTAWDTQRDAIFILRSHMDTLLARAGLQRVPVNGGTFDPAVMSAAEVVTDAALPDHTVVAELLTGWQLTGGARLVRPAQVRVSRRP